MTKRLQAKKKISRQLGVNLWGRPNDTFVKRNYRPGQHGLAAKRVTSHSIHLKAKQKVRRYYGAEEGQFRALFDKSKRLRGNTGDVFAGLLESRLQSIVYRIGFAPTIYAARQLISHKHILVNGRPINIASYIINPGDVVSVVPKAQKMVLIAESLQQTDRDIPAYLEWNADNMAVKLLNRPLIGDIAYPFEPEFNLIVEFYSK